VVFGVTVTVPPPVPEPGDTDSQGASSAAVHSSVPWPELETLSVLAAGLVPVNDRLAGATERTGEPGSLTHVIGRPMSADSSAAESARS
jgi:hypothetical protein